MFKMFFFFLLWVPICNIYCQGGPFADEYMKIADDFKNNSKPDSAMFYYEKAALEFRSTGHIEKLVNAYNQLGIILTRQDQYDDAKSYLEQALSVGLPVLDSNHLAIANTYISLGVIYRAKGHYQQSLLFHNKALAIRMLKCGEYSTEVATSYGNIGNVHFSIGDLIQSIAAHTKAMEIRERLFGPKSPEII